MTNCDHEGQIFYSILTQIMDYFSCSPLNTSFYLENMKSPYLCFISYLYLDLYVLGIDAWILGVFQVNQASMCLIHIKTKDDVGAVKTV